MVRAQMFDFEYSLWFFLLILHGPFGCIDVDVVPWCCSVAKFVPKVLDINSGRRLDRHANRVKSTKTSFAEKDTGLEYVELDRNALKEKERFFRSNVLITVVTVQTLFC